MTPDTGATQETKQESMPLGMVLNSPVPIRVRKDDGAVVEFKLRRVCLNDFASLEDALRSRNVETYVKAAREAGLDAATISQGIQEVMNAVVRGHEHMATFYGMRHLVWCSARRDNPQLTLEELGAIVTDRDVSTMFDLVMAGGNEADKPADPPKTVVEG